MMARAITNTPMVNCEPKDELIQRLQLQLVELQDQLNLAKAQGGKAAADELLQQQLHAMEVAYADLQEQQLQEQEQQQLLQEQHERLQEQHERLQKQHQQLQEQLVGNCGVLGGFFVRGLVQLWVSKAQPHLCGLCAIQRSALAC